MDTLLNFSGGIDSTYVLYNWLKSNPDKKILVHHIHIRNRENRFDKEAESVQKILEWLRKKGLDNFEYIESVFDYRQTKGLCLDGLVINFFTALISEGYPEIRYTLLCTPLDEKLRLGHNLDSRRRRYESLRNAVGVGVNLSAKEVVIDMFKQEIIAALPPDLYELTWYCRRPQEDGSTCGECHTCKQVQR